MTAADEWAGLARLAEAATPGPWEDRRDDLTDEVAVVHDQEQVSYVAEIGVVGMPRVEADAEFIAAANPATILRLVNENENLRGEVQHIAEGLGKSAVKRNDLRAERDELAARLAAVEALHRPRVVDVLSGDCASETCEHEDECPTVPFQQCAECDRIADEADTYYAERGVGITQWPCPTVTALAAPTDTTKEQS